MPLNICVGKSSPVRAIDCVLTTDKVDRGRGLTPPTVTQQFKGLVKSQYVPV